MVLGWRTHGLIGEAHHVQANELQVAAALLTRILVKRAVRSQREPEFAHHKAADAILKVKPYMCSGGGSNVASRVHEGLIGSRWEGFWSMWWHVMSEHVLDTGIIDAAPSCTHPDKGLFDPVALEVRPEVNAAFVPTLRLHVVAQTQVQHLGRKKPRLMDHGHEVLNIIERW